MKNVLFYVDVCTKFTCIFTIKRPLLSAWWSFVSFVVLTRIRQRINIYPLAES